MPVTLSSRSDISLKVFERVAWQGASVRVSAVALERIDRSRAGFLRLLERPEVVVYGVTSGYGDRAGVALGAAERGRQSQAVARLSGSFGETLPERVRRGIVLARLANLLDGYAGVSRTLLVAVASMLDGRPLPPVPLRGNGGSGEILALAHLFGPLIESCELGAKEGLALVNGSPCAAALVADAVLAARRRLDLTYNAFALSIEAYGAPLDAYDEALDELWGDGHEQQALRELRARLSDQIVRRAHQGPVAFRILPRVLGQVERAVTAAAEAAEISLRAVTDNPVYLPPSNRHPDGRVLSTGGYHNAAAPATLHQLAVAWADLCQLAERHIERHACGTDDGTDGAALAHLFLMLGVAYSEDARTAAQPVILPRGAPGQNDVGAPVFLAWEREQRAAEAFENMMAILLAAAYRLIDLQNLHPSLMAFADSASKVGSAVSNGDSFGRPLAQLTARLHAATVPRPKVPYRALSHTPVPRRAAVDNLGGRRCFS